jgi:hypothetical protein
MKTYRRTVAQFLICMFLAACGAGRPQPGQNATPNATAPAQRTTANRTQDWVKAWLINANGETSSVFKGVLVNVTSVTTKTIAGKVYQCITASGIPNYETTITESHVHALNSRQKAATDFVTGVTSATVNDVVAFGEDIGYLAQQGCTAGKEGNGYWPNGPACPADQNKEQCFPLEPQPATEPCAGGAGSVGTWVNGVAIYNWTDTMSYKREGVWQNEAYHFENNDLDICPGHSANGDYHHHSNPVCLADQLKDTGAAHSPIYGFGADGFPVYGPWHANGVLANSCWKARDYDDPKSATGCGVAGERSCLLVDRYDISKGTTPARSPGPSTRDLITSLSGNQWPATSGYYLQDYYYDASCTKQGIGFLDKYNGHEHDGLGYHYHVTQEKTSSGKRKDVFPFYIAPIYAGVLQDNSIATCSTGEFGPPGGGPGGGRPNLAVVAAELNITERQLMDALGPPPPDLAAAAKKLGVTEEVLRAAFDKAR